MGVGGGREDGREGSWVSRRDGGIAPSARSVVVTAQKIGKNKIKSYMVDGKSCCACRSDVSPFEIYLSVSQANR